MKNKTHERTHTHTYNHMNTHIHTHTHANRHTHTYTHAHKETRMHARVRSRAFTHTQSVLSWSEVRVCGTTCRTMSKRLDPSSCLSRYLKLSNFVNPSKYRLFLNFVTVPLTLFELFVVKYDAKCPTSSQNTPVWNALRSTKFMCDYLAKNTSSSHFTRSGLIAPHP